MRRHTLLCEQLPSMESSSIEDEALPVFRLRDDLHLCRSSDTDSRPRCSADDRIAAGPQTSSAADGSSVLNTCPRESMRGGVLTRKPAPALDLDPDLDPPAGRAGARGWHQLQARRPAAALPGARRPAARRCEKFDSQPPNRPQTLYSSSFTGRWLEPESNRRHEVFQTSALPTELSSRPAIGGALCPTAPRTQALFPPRKNARQGTRGAFVIGCFSRKHAASSLSPLPPRRGGQDRR